MGVMTEPSGATEPTGATNTATLQRTWKSPRGLLGQLMLVDHKTVGLRIIVTGFVFFLLGGVESLLMRIQLGGPSNTFLSPEAYNQVFTMHGSTMMFLFATPIMEGLGVYLIPLMIGSRDILFPRLNAFSYWTYLLGGAVLYVSFFFGAAPDGGWFAYVPLTGPIYSPGLNLDFWNIGLTIVEISTVSTAIYLIATIFKARAPGMTLNRMPLFVWAILVQGFMIVFAMPPLLTASVLMELDRRVGTHFFDPAAGGDPLLWQHLFWIFGHPEVYLIFIPALGVVSMVISTFSRKRIFAYTLMALAIVTIGFASFGLWVHHMFATGIADLGLSFFTAASMMITIPSGVQFFCWIATLWGGRLRVTTAFLYVIGFVVIFIIGGVTGVMVASVPFDLQATDTYFIVAHLHYVLIGGVVFPLFAAFYYWFPKATGRMLHEGTGKWGFWLEFIGFNLTFFPMHILGLMGMQRRIYTYLPGTGWGPLNLLETVGAFILGLGVLLFIINVFRSLRDGAPAGNNPWNAPTLEWATTSPPPPYNFAVIPTVRSAYPLWDDPTPQAEQPGGEAITLRADRPETLITGALDAEPQYRRTLAEPSIWPFVAAFGVTILWIGWMTDIVVLALGALLTFVALVGWLWPENTRANDDRAGFALPTHAHGRRDPGWWAMFLLVIVNIVLFASLLLSYYYLRGGNTSWPPTGYTAPNLTLPTIGLALLVVSAGAMWWAVRASRLNDVAQGLVGLGVALALGITFVVLESVSLGQLSFSWRTNAFGSVFFTLAVAQIVNAFIGLLILLVGFALVGRRQLTYSWRAATEIVALYWYFVVGIWIPIWVTLYIISRLM